MSDGRLCRQPRPDQSCRRWGLQRGLDGNRQISDQLRHDILVLKRTTGCLSQNFKDVGARLGAAAEAQGKDLERALKKELAKKASNLSEIIDALDINSKSPELKAKILADAKAARDGAERPYDISADFAQVLDPTVVISTRVSACEPASQSLA
jgi:hypothetical protein